MVMVLEQELGQALVLGQVPVLGQVLVQVLRIPQPPVRLTGPISLPEKIIFYSISSSFKKWDLNLPILLESYHPQSK